MKVKICTGMAVSFGLLLLIHGIFGGMAAGSPARGAGLAARAAGSPAGDAGSPAGATRDTNSFTVGLTVEDALGVSLDGESSCDSAIRIGDPATGVVSYVILDG
ncbi:MAG: hypothetical protein HZB44_09360 [Actinobacteria bacterium]|nr:hypothetical protein [Actinomycetota bacterium]